MTGSPGVGGEAQDDVRRDDEPAFEAPWQARAFAVAVQLTERGEGDLPWETFQERLVEEIEADGEDVEAAVDIERAVDVEATEAVYYEQWLRALERLLVEEGFLAEDELAERALEFESGDRDAAEFVIGEHGHSHDGHGHGNHDHGHGNDHHHHGHEH